MAEQAKTKSTGFMLNAVALVLGLVGLICYLLSGEDKSHMTETVVSALVYIPFILSILASATGFFIKGSMPKIAAFSLYFLTLALWLLTQAGYIVNVFMGIDGNTFSIAYILCVIGMIVPMILSIVSAAMRK